MRPGPIPRTLMPPTRRPPTIHPLGHVGYVPYRTRVEPYRPRTPHVYPHRPRCPHALCHTPTRCSLIPPLSMSPPLPMCSSAMCPSFPPSPSASPPPCGLGPLSTPTTNHATCHMALKHFRPALLNCHNATALQPLPAPKTRHACSGQRHVVVLMRVGDGLVCGGAGGHRLTCQLHRHRLQLGGTDASVVRLGYKCTSMSSTTIRPFPEHAGQSPSIALITLCCAHPHTSHAPHASHGPHAAQVSLPCFIQLSFVLKVSHMRATLELCVCTILG